MPGDDGTEQPISAASKWASSPSELEVWVRKLQTTDGKLIGGINAGINVEALLGRVTHDGAEVGGTDGRPDPWTGKGQPWKKLSDRLHA